MVELSLLDAQRLSSLLASTVDPTCFFNPERLNGNQGMPNNLAVTVLMPHWIHFCLPTAFPSIVYQ